MSPQTRFAKTDKGREELETRTYKLHARQRTLLVIVDGKRPVEELLKTATSLGGGKDLLDSLLKDGFISEVSEAAAAATAAAPAELSEPERAKVYAAKAAMRRYIKLAAVDQRALSALVDEVRVPDDVLRALGEIRARFEAAGFGEAYANLQKELSGKA